MKCPYYERVNEVMAQGRSGGIVLAIRRRMTRIKKGIWALALLAGWGLLGASAVGAAGGCSLEALGQKLGLSQAAASEALERRLGMKVLRDRIGETDGTRKALGKIAGGDASGVHLPPGQPAAAPFGAGPGRETEAPGGRRHLNFLSL